MADEIRDTLGIETQLVAGARGEFSVRIDGQVVIQKSGDDFPTPEQCVNAVRRAG